jgi:hypothetical protein
MLTNNFELLLPIIEYTQMFFFMGFFNILQGRMGTFFINFNLGTIDPYRILSKLFPFQFNVPPGLPDPVENAGLTSSILSNLLPDIALIFLATIIYLFTKYGTD